MIKEDIKYRTGSFNEATQKDCLHKNKVVKAYTINDHWQPGDTTGATYYCCPDCDKQWREE